MTQYGICARSRAAWAALLLLLAAGAVQAQENAQPGSSAQPPPSPPPAPGPAAPPEHAHPETPVSEGHPVEAAPAAPAWTDNLTIGAYVDAYMAVRSTGWNNSNHLQITDSGNPKAIPGTSQVPNGYPAGPIGPAHEAYVQNSGFSLASAGVDIAYAGEQFGATISLRFGPSVTRFYAADQSPFGIENILQAYVTWKPVKHLSMDLGQFYTIFGAEVFESWRNMNYSRGALYYSMQPFWHTGLRANYVVNDKIAFNTMLVDGVNTSFEGSNSPTLGVQAIITPIEELFLAAGFMVPFTPRTYVDEVIPTRNFQDFFDFIATLNVGDLKIVTNADVNVYRAKGTSSRQNWWGISVAPGYSFARWFGVSARVEYVQDSANSQLAMPGVTGQTHLTTLTGTLDFKPIPNSASLILRPEFRYEWASDDDYQSWNAHSVNSKLFWSAHLGVVVTSM